MNKRILILVLAVLLVAGVLFFLSQRTKSTGPKIEVNEECLDFYESPSPNNWAGDTIDLNSVSEEDELEWVFIQTEKEDVEYEASGNSTFIVIDVAGPYVGIVSNPAGCIDTFYFEIEEQLVEEEEDINVRIKGPGSGMVGQELEFEARGVTAEKYEWSMGEAGGVIEAGNKMKYTYNTPGKYQIKLQLDNGLYVKYKTVVINPEREDVVETVDELAKLKAKYEQSAKAAINEIVGLGSADDFDYDTEKARDLFNKKFKSNYTCGDVTFEVNGKPIGELAFFRALQYNGSTSNYKATDVKLEYNKEDQCFNKYKITGSFSGL